MSRNHFGGTPYYPPASRSVPPVQREAPAYQQLNITPISREVHAGHVAPLRADNDIDPMNVSRAWPTSYAPDSTYTVYPDDRRDRSSNEHRYHRSSDSPTQRHSDGQSAEERRRQREAEASVKNLTFDGEEKSSSTTWEFFADRFVLAATTARWDGATTKLRLLSCLRGGATRTISHLPREASFLDVWEALRQRYSAIGQEAAFAVKLAKRTRNTNKESAQAFLDDITYLSRNAYPRSSKDDLAAAIKKHFLLGHPESFQNHLNAAVNMRTGSTEDLLQACRQYESMAIERKTVSAKKPAVRYLSKGKELTQREEALLAALRLDTGGTDSEDSVEATELDLFQTTARKSRRRQPKLRSKPKRNPKAALQAVEVYPGCQDSTDSPDEDWAENLELADSDEELVSDSLKKISAALNALGAGSQAEGNSGPNPRFVCLYCTKRGHGFAYCHKLKSDFPDGKIPPKVALSLFTKLMNLQSARRAKRSANPKSHGPRDRQDKENKLRAITANVEIASEVDLDDLSLNL